jgi:hypothetical protein
LTEFRETLYQYLNRNKRADGVFDLIDALCSTPSAHSAVELSLSPQFRRGHAALYKAIAACQLTNADIAALAKPVLAHAASLLVVGHRCDRLFADPAGVVGSG